MSVIANQRGAMRFRYVLRREAFELDVDSSVALRGITGVFGPSGAGKTTLLRCVAGLEQADVGELAIDDDVWQGDGIDLPPHKRDIGYVFQEPRLFPHLDVRRNLEYGLKRSRSKSQYEFGQIVAILGLEALLERTPANLSGGEAQRVAIGRALLKSPRILLMDEPVAALDVARRDEVLPFIRSLNQSLDVPILFVSHNIDEICMLCDQLLVMERGRSLVYGALEDVLTRTDLPVLAGEEAGSVMSAKPVDYDVRDGLSEVAVSAGRLWVPGRYESASTLRLRLRANDISLCREPPRRSSILNVLPATIDHIQEESDYSVLVHLVVGDDRLVSRITRRSAAELELAPGETVTLQIKSVSVRHA